MKTDDVLEMIRDKVLMVPLAGCWLWAGGTQSQGYGDFSISGRARGRLRLHKDGTITGRTTVHKIVWTCLNGVVPKGKVIRHRCDTRLCCNPHHLELGSAKENMQDMIARNRGKNQFSKDNQPGKRV